MRTPEDIYAAYHLLPSIRMHQLRVAAVGKTICDAFATDVDTETVILTGLFHDMANIVKANLALFPEFVEPEGLAHWELQKRRFIDAYGENEHDASLQIARELGLPQAVQEEIGYVGFGHLKEIRDSDSYVRKICEYSDLRVGPHGVLSMESRLREARERYRVQKDSSVPQAEDRFDELYAAAEEVERQIFALSALAPDDITEASIQETIVQLRGMPLPY